MRINVYAEELTQETIQVSKVVDAGQPNERTFYGVRLFLKSPEELHHTPNDDDRSAITLWVPWTREKGNDPEFVETLLKRLVARLQTVPINVTVTSPLGAIEAAFPIDDDEDF